EGAAGNARRAALDGPRGQENHQPRDSAGAGEGRRGEEAARSRARRYEQGLKDEMTSIMDREPGRRWPRSQRFVLSAKGADAGQKWRATIVASRSEGGRGSFDAARDAWAQPLRLQ